MLEWSMLSNFAVVLALFLAVIGGAVFLAIFGKGK